MPDYTITVTTEEDAAITARRKAEAPTLPDNATFIATVVQPRIVGDALKAFIESRVQVIADLYRNGTSAQRTAVDKALGL